MLRWVPSAPFGVPVVPVQANAGKGIVELKQALRHPFPAVPGAAWKDGPAENLGDRRRALALRICEVAARRPDGHASTASDKLDAWLLHPIWGWFAFIALWGVASGKHR